MLGRPFRAVPEYLRNVARERGPFVRFTNPLHTYYLVDDPELIEQILVAKAPSFVKTRAATRLRPLLGESILTAEKTTHLRRRRLVQPAFHRARIDACAGIIVEETKRRVGLWKPGEELDVQHEMMGLALGIVAKALCGADLSDELDTMGHAMDDIVAMFPQLLLPFSEHFDGAPTPGRIRYRKAARDLDAIVHRLLAEHRRGEGAGGLIEMLIDSRIDGEFLTDEQIRDEALTILLAGHETTANAMAWTFAILQQHSDFEAKVRAHVDAVLGSRDATLEDAVKLDYLHAFVAEALRLYPPIWLLGRTAETDVTLGSYTIRRGEMVIASQYVTHRNPNYWDDPQRFDPDRWLAGPPKEKFAYFPFGGGNRVCIGERFARLEAVLAIATIVRHVRFERVGTEKLEMEPLLTLRPKGAVRARVSLRSLP